MAKHYIDAEAAKKAQQELCPGVSLIPERYTKTIHFVRHGQGFHNVAGHKNHDLYKSWDFVDSHLTEVGWQQAEQLGQHVAALRLPIELVVVAPMQRALETAVGAFGRQLPATYRNSAPTTSVDGMAANAAPLLMAAQAGLAGKTAARPAVSSWGCPPFVAHEACREMMGVHPCDRRSAVSTYKQRFPAVDFSLVQPDEDLLWEADRREDKAEISRRGLAFVAWLAARPERSIAVVSHSCFLFYTLGCFGHHSVAGGKEERDHAVVRGELHRWYDNCEMRSVVMAADGAVGVAAAARRREELHFVGGARAAGGH